MFSVEGDKKKTSALKKYQGGNSLTWELEKAWTKQNNASEQKKQMCKILICQS